MAMTSVTVRVDEATKKEAAEIAEDFGFDLSSITRAFYKQIVREGRIPLNLSYGEPNKDSLEAIKEAQELIASGHPGYSSAEEMFAAMGV
jgi:DNA-damage-inducible protein J